VPAIVTACGWVARKKEAAAWQPVVHVRMHSVGDAFFLAASLLLQIRRAFSVVRALGAAHAMR
jgi:hypothetical protein